MERTSKVSEVEGEKTRGMPEVMSYLRPSLACFFVLLLSAVVGPGARAQEGGATKTAQEKAQERLDAAGEAQSQAEALLGHADYGAALSRDPSMESSLDRARQLLSTARSSLTAAGQRGTDSAFRDAGVLASGARRAFEDFAARVRKQLRAIDLERNPPPPPPPPRPPPEPIEEPRPAAESSGDGSKVEEPAAGGAPPTTARPRTRSRTPPPASLRRAAEVFFSGDYGATIEQLAPLDTPQAMAPAASAHGHLLRAAARYALFLLGGEQDFTLRGGAIEDILACRTADAELEPGELFSPRFRDFFTATR